MIISKLIKTPEDAYKNDVKC